MSLGLIQLAVTGTVSGLQNNQAANTALGALATIFSGGTAPTAGNTGLGSVAGLPWRDTSVTPNQIKLRDDADTVWMPQWMVDQTGKVAAPYHSGVRATTGTSETIAATDLGKLVTFTNAGAIAVTLPQATTAGLGKGFWFLARCLPGSTGSATITPTTSTIDGAANIVLRPGLTAIIQSDGTNYFTAGYLNYSNLRVDGPVGINATPISQSRLVVGGSISVNGSDSNFALGGNRAMIDLAGAKARVGGINGGGSNVDLDLYARNAAVATLATGLAMAGATGGDMGAGTGNFTGIYVNGVAFTGAPKVALYQNQQASNTAGPDFSTGSWQTWPLTTEVYDAGGIGSLASNQITLGAGSYLVTAFAAAIGISGPGAAQQRLRLQNITDGTTLDQGPSSGGMGSATNGTSSIISYFTLAGSKAIELQCYWGTNNPPALTALNTGAVEVYASVMIQKVA